MLEDSHLNHPDSASAHNASLSDSLHNVQTQQPDNDESSGPQAVTSSDSHGYPQLERLRVSSPTGLGQLGKRRASEDLVPSHPSKRIGLCQYNHLGTQGTLKTAKNEKVSSTSESNIQDDRKPNVVYEAQSSTSGNKVYDVEPQALEATVTHLTETVADLKETVRDLEHSVDSIFGHLVELDSKQHLQHRTTTNHLEEMITSLRALHARVEALESQ